jgi:hypothetical protein
VAEITFGDDMLEKPYIDSNLSTEGYIRLFPDDISPDLLVWHRDVQNRLVTVLEGEKWLLQFENLMPFELVNGMVYTIPKYTYHRIIKGENNLVLNIKEENNERVF